MLLHSFWKRIRASRCDVLQAMSDRREDLSRSFGILAVLFVAGCDPAARFVAVGAADKDIVWPVGADSVKGRVDAHAFSLGLSIFATISAPAGGRLELDSADMDVRDVHGTRLELRMFADECRDSTARRADPTRHCIFADIDLHSANYNRLDTIRVMFGYATSHGNRVPLRTIFVRSHAGESSIGRLSLLILLLLATVVQAVYGFYCLVRMYWHRKPYLRRYNFVPSEDELTPIGQKYMRRWLWSWGVGLGLSLLASLLRSAAT
jgi:hypothetical protein